MSLRFALLGLVALRPRSGYEIKRTFERSIFYIWNVTGAQIYNTIRDLREEGLITSEAVAQEGRPDKQVHTITAAGRAALAAQGGEPIREEMLRDKVLLRIFFGNFVESEVMAREIDAYLERVRGEAAYLQSVERRVVANPGPEHEARRFQLLSLRLKMAQLRAMDEVLVREGYGRSGVRRRDGGAAAETSAAETSPAETSPAGAGG